LLTPLTKAIGSARVSAAVFEDDAVADDADLSAEGWLML
jgi:hypothetical protein